ncbi:MAG: multi-sensor signal transduction histidine kinase [Acidobacteriaceae bacterium]|nr:multi-sensor signal transduction histidine kinase [Acidobacteriaceae bacterium]
MALSSSIQSRALAGNVHRPYRTSLAAAQPSALPMNRDFQIRFTAGFLALFTVAAITLAWINFQKESQFVAPYDGISWVERNNGVFADRVEPEGPGARAGIEPGDRLSAVNGIPVSHVNTLIRQMYGAGAWSKVRYSLQRGSASIDAAPILVAQEHTFNVWLRLIGLIYLGIGLYVLFRRWTAPGSTHFYVFCLVSFVFCSFHFTGKLNAFDRTIYWGNIVANMLQPVLLLHFVLTFPEKYGALRKHRWLATSIYVPGLLLLCYHVLAVASSRASENLLWRLDRLWMAYLAVYFVGAATVLLHSYSMARRPILRQQLKWLTRGTVLAISPFTVLYVLPYVFPGLGFAPMKLSVITLGILPLTFGYAIFRYKLMDVDLIFKRGMAYTLAAMAIAGAYFTAIALVGALVHTRVPNAGTTGLVLAIVITALLADPLRKWIQERMDRLFYRTRYDYRQTLVEFGRELSAEPDLDKMLTAVVDRLSRTLLVDRMAIFLSSGERAEQFILAKSFGIQQTAGLDLTFLSIDRPEAAEGHIFFENTHHVPRENSSARESIARLELNYYIPCRAQKSTVAVLGLGKTVTGDFLSSEDVELLETVAGYLAIAIQNSRLYASLEQKVTQYERLKDFNENIVESINVGVLAVDLADRIESWNSQMEVMYALPRWQALTRSLSDVFPPEFIEEFSRVRHSPGIHNLYKFRLPVPTGETRTVNVAIAPLVTKNFNVAGRLIIMDDITERVELEHQLSQSDKLSSIGLLAAGVAHEVNTPLAVISSYAQMLSKQVQGDQQKSTLLEKITRQTFRASEIVNNLLNFSRTSGAEFAEVDVNRVIVDTLSLLEHQFKTTRIRVQDELAPHLPPIQGNAGRLQQVFLNLFLNAKDAMPDGGTLKIATSNGDGVSVTVSDTGLGIAQEHIHRIYDPFFTTKSVAPDGQKRGTGLGLSVTYGIIQEHAGKIRVESSPEQGTTFYIDFPMLRKAVNV